MFGSGILEVAIGLGFIYLLLSLVCSVILELMTQLFNLRARNLRSGILNLVKDAHVLDALYEHHLIAGLKPEGKRDPAYIPAKAFATALLDHLELVAPVDPHATLVSRQETIEKSIDNIPDAYKNLKTAMKSFFRKANGDVENIQTELEKWFDDSMNGLSDWYKSRTQGFLLGIGLIVCIAMNADAIRIVQVLARNDQMRAAIVNRAQVVVQGKDAPTGKEAITELTAIEFPLGWPSADPSPTPSPSATTSPKPSAKPTVKPSPSSTPLTSPSPVTSPSPDVSPSPSGNPSAKPSPGTDGSGAGKPNSNGSEKKSFPDPNPHPFFKFVGFLVSALAVSLGAPFWFDMLNKLVSLKPGGKSDEKKKDSGNAGGGGNAGGAGHP